MTNIIVLTSNESGANSLSDINTNYAALNADKVETSTTVNGYALSGNISLTAADVGALAGSGVNTGDETNASIKTKLGAASASNDGYLVQADWSNFNSKVAASVIDTDITLSANSDAKLPSQHAVKTYVDTASANGITWQNPVIAIQSTPAVGPSGGDRYIVLPTGTGAWAGHNNTVTTWNGAAWTFATPSVGWTVFNDADTKIYNYNGSAWVATNGGSTTWGSIGGTLTDQTDLQTVLGLKANLAGPTFTGTVTAPTVVANTVTAAASTTATLTGGSSASIGTQGSAAIVQGGANSASGQGGDVLLRSGTGTTTGNIKIQNSNGSKSAKMDVSALTTERAFAWPDVAGTLVTGGGTASGTNTGDQDLSGKVSTTVTVNGHALSSNVTVTTTDLSLNNVTNNAQVKKSASSTNGAIPTWSGTTGDTLNTGGLVAPAGTIVGTSDTQSLTNKNLVGAGNTFPTFNQNTTGSAALALALKSASTTVDVSAASAPTTGQVLTATSTTAATWQTPTSSGGNMILASAQTVTGAKTFNAGTLLDKGEIVFDVKAFGAVGNDSTDDTTAIQNTIAAAGASGGTVWFPPGTYKITTSLKLYNSVPTPNVPYSNVTIAGAGASGVLGTVIKQYTTGEDVIKGLNNVTNTVQLLNVTIQDVCLAFGGTATNSGNGIYFKQVAAGGPSFQNMYIKNVVATEMQGSGKYGFNFESMIVSTVTTCQAVSCANGFYLNGAVGGAFNSVSTSVAFINCYANMSTNGVVGYNCLDNTYVSYFSCACDIGANGAGSSYLVDSSNCVSFTGCGSELNGTSTQANLWKITNGSSQIGIYNCYGFQPKSSKCIYVTGTSLGVTIVGFQSNSAVSGSTGLTIDAGSEASELDCSFADATARTINATAIYRNISGISSATSATTGTMTVPMIYDIITITPTNACTFNGTNGHIGQKASFYITTSGTSSFVLTWGTNFKTTGTLATGTSSAKVFVVDFVCKDGTTWAEVSRTTAM